MKMQIFQVSVGLLMMCRVIVCPFPPSHPYSFLNPVIDPWWSQLDQDTQKDIYNLWEQHEPSLFALSMYIFLQGVPYHWIHFVFVIFPGSGAHTEELFIAIG